MLLTERSDVDIETVVFIKVEETGTLITWLDKRDGAYYYTAKGKPSLLTRQEAINLNLIDGTRALFSTQ